jgi:hypothetical protein
LNKYKYSKKYENKNEINSGHKDMGRDLPIYHTISISIGKIITGIAFVSKNAIPYADIGSLGRIYWCSICRLCHSSAFN